MDVDLTMATQLESKIAIMDVDSTMATELESKKAATEHFSSGEASSSQAAVPPPPYGLTPEAMKALGEEGSEVLMCSGSRLLLFRGSKALQGNSPVPLPADSDDIFADFDPNHHILIVQRGQKTFLPLRPTKAIAMCFKGQIERAARSRRQGVNRKRNQQVQYKEGGSGEKTHGKSPSAINVTEPVLRKNNSRLIVIKKVAGNLELHISNPNSILNPARKKEKFSPLGVIFTEWKLSTAALPALPLVPSLNSHLPWLYFANPATSKGNHIFGNMATQQSMLVANSDLQSTDQLLYSKDGWLLFLGRQVDSLDERFARSPIFLWNPTTGARMDLPGICFLGGCAAFCTTTEGTPEVVIYVHSMGCTVTVHMVRPGGACWEEHPYEFSHWSPGYLDKMVLCGSYVYCFFELHCHFFKLTDLSWHPVKLGTPYSKILQCVALEIEGKVVIVSYPEYFTSYQLACDPIRFFKMEMSGDNVKLAKITGSDELLDGRIWFIDGLQSFSVKVAGSGQKMCWFVRKALIKQGRQYGCACELHCLNLTTRAHRRLIADSVRCRQRAWVDLGCLSDCSLLDCGITGDDLLPGF